MRLARFLILGGAAGVLPGCYSPPPPDIHSQDAVQLIPAIKIAVQRHDQSAVPFLVEDLSSTDSAVRLYAIDGLRRLTGEDFGYRAYDTEAARRPAVLRWEGWLAARNKTVSEHARQSGNI